jgi:uncharacterized OB-fold protein
MTKPATPAKPLPAITALNRPYFQCGLDNKLKLQQCDNCQKLRYPFAKHCPRCLSRDYHWQPLSGRAKLWSWIVMHQVYIRGFTDDVPYIVAYVELEEGPHMISTVVGADHAALACDQPLEVAFQKAGDDVWLPVFRPAAPSAT